MFPGMFTLLGFTVFLGRASQYLLQLFLVTVPTPGCLASRGARRNLRLVMRQVTFSPGTGVGPARWGAQREVQLAAANESCR